MPFWNLLWNCVIFDDQIWRFAAILLAKITSFLLFDLETLNLLRLFLLFALFLTSDSVVLSRITRIYRYELLSFYWFLDAVQFFTRFASSTTAPVFVRRTHTSQRSLQMAEHQGNERQKWRGQVQENFVLSRKNQASGQKPGWFRHQTESRFGEVATGVPQAEFAIGHVQQCSGQNKGRIWSNFSDFVFS